MTHGIIKALEAEINQRLSLYSIYDKSWNTIHKTSVDHYKAFLLFKKNCPKNTIMTIGETNKRLKWNEALNTMEKRRKRVLDECQGITRAIQIIKSGMNN